MTGQEREPQTRSLFAKMPLYTDGVEDEGHRTYVLALDPEALGGFETDAFTSVMVADIIRITFNSMKKHGASALGLDLDSMFGRIHATDKLFAAMDVGATILGSYAPRTDGETWDSWMRAEFPVAMAVMYGEDSNPAQLAATEMTG